MHHSLCTARSERASIQNEATLTVTRLTAKFAGAAAATVLLQMSAASGVDLATVRVSVLTLARA